MVRYHHALLFIISISNVNKINMLRFIDFKNGNTLIINE